MFELELYDRVGNKLKMGDIVKISNGRDFTFFAEVKYLEEEQQITPFHTFSFHSFEKINKLPDNVVLSTEKRYKIWFLQNPKQDFDAFTEGEQYLLDWRQCERLLEQRCFRIKPL